MTYSSTDNDKQYITHNFSVEFNLQGRRGILVHGYDFPQWWDSSDSVNPFFNLLLSSAKLA